MDLKVLMSTILDLWKKFWVSLGHKFIRKKARPSRDSVLEFWSSDASCSKRESIFRISAMLREGQYVFVSLPSRRLC